MNDVHVHIGALNMKINDLRKLMDGIEARLLDRCDFLEKEARNRDTELTSRHDSVEARLLSRCQSLENELRLKEEKLASRDEHLEEKLVARCAALESELRSRDELLLDLRARLNTVEAVLENPNLRSSGGHTNPAVLSPYPEACKKQTTVSPKEETYHEAPIAEYMEIKPELEVVSTPSEPPVPYEVTRSPPKTVSLESVLQNPSTWVKALLGKRQRANHTPPTRKRAKLERKWGKISPVRDEVLGALSRLPNQRGTSEQIMQSLSGDSSLNKRQVADALFNAKRSWPDLVSSEKGEGHGTKTGVALPHVWILKKPFKATRPSAKNGAAPRAEAHAASNAPFTQATTCFTQQTINAAC